MHPLNKGISSLQAPTWTHYNMLKPIPLKKSHFGTGEVLGGLEKSATGLEKMVQGGYN